jgi:hypothetical protein
MTPIQLIGASAGAPAVTGNATGVRAKRSPAVFLLVAIVALIHLPAQANNPSLFERFFGSYEGTSTSIPDGEIAARNHRVMIMPYEGGFMVDWVTVMHKANGRIKRVGYSIAFKPTRRKNIYASAMRMDLFGHRVPLDPLKGDPFVWATLSGDTLTVYAVHITDSGGEDLQIDKRTLTPQGLDLEFVRLRDEQPVRRVRATLQKIDDVNAKRAKRAIEPGRPLTQPES